TAHVSNSQKLTYAELRQRSDALAGNLLKRFGEHRDPVAVLGHREPEILVAFLGAIKSGRPYLPLDTALPQQRIDKILSLSGASIVLTPSEIAALTRSVGLRPHRAIKRDDPFYILFTSGSSGEPKGVTITARCLEHFLSWMLAEQNFAPLRETFLNQAP